LSGGAGHWVIISPVETAAGFLSSVLVL